MQHLSRLQRSAHNTVNGFNPHGNCPQRQTHGTRYIITVIPVLNVNAGDDCIHAAAAALIQPPLPPRPPAPARPRAPKKGHYSGRTTKAKTVTSPRAHTQRAMLLFNPACPHKCASFSSPSLRQSTHKRSTCPYLNSQWQSIISAVDSTPLRAPTGPSFPGFSMRRSFSRIEQRKTTDPDLRAGSMNPSNQP